MQNKYFKFVLPALFILFIVPQIALAAWYNPFSWSWDIFDWFHTSQVVVPVSIVKNPNSTPTPVLTNPVTPPIKVISPIENQQWRGVLNNRTFSPSNSLYPIMESFTLTTASGYVYTVNFTNKTSNHELPFIVSGDIFIVYGTLSGDTITASSAKDVGTPPPPTTGQSCISSSQCPAKTECIVGVNNCNPVLGSSGNPGTCQVPAMCAMPAKPVIYLYPTHKEPVSVQLNYDGTVTDTYPQFDDSASKAWNVVAYPDGHLTDDSDGKTYSYLFWEGIDSYQYHLSTGFVVKGSDTASFLQSQLASMGLTPKEYNEMVVYWLPKMQHNRYNLIHFAGSDYTNVAKLNIAPKPDSLLRVFMVWEPLQDSESIQPQIFPTFCRNGFTVVEWGGEEVGSNIEN